MKYFMLYLLGVSISGMLHNFMMLFPAYVSFLRNNIEKALQESDIKDIINILGEINIDQLISLEIKLEAICSWYGVYKFFRLLIEFLTAKNKF